MAKKKNAYVLKLEKLDGQTVHQKLIDIEDFNPNSIRSIDFKNDFDQCADIILSSLKFQDFELHFNHSKYDLRYPLDSELKRRKKV